MLPSLGELFYPPFLLHQTSLL
uniref:Uncharacterized protein n=1 Tax=Moniliophthora roreri TaxID=221103 RepID=A0A0W0F6P1_MONRR